MSRYMSIMNEEEEEALYSPSDDNCRKFGNGKPMKIRRLTGIHVFPLRRVFIERTADFIQFRE